MPAAALQLLPGRGRYRGRLVADERVRGVMFPVPPRLRSSSTARSRRGGNTVLIAETGGQNAMIVDSTALPSRSSPT